MHSPPKDGKRCSRNMIASNSSLFGTLWKSSTARFDIQSAAVTNKALSFLLPRAEIEEEA